MNSTHRKKKKHDHVRGEIPEVSFEVGNTMGIEGPGEEMDLPAAKDSSHFLLGKKPLRSK